MLLKQEGGDNPVFDSYRSKFEDQYGDLHDWQASTSTHLYLCRQLYLHYTQVVRQTSPTHNSTQLKRPLRPLIGLQYPNWSHSKTGMGMGKCTLYFDLQEQDVRVQEWKDYLSTAKIHRNATYWELPVGHDRSKVGCMTAM